METPTAFASLAEECEHWKAEARKYYKEHADVKEELDEFQESSQQLEAELEASLEQKEKQCRDLSSTVQQLQLETESLYKRLVTCQTDYAQLEQRCSTVTVERDQLKAYTRQLEQINDNLERDLRVVNENVTGFETMLNEAYEKNALLEMEVDDKEQLQVMLQRLKDESRDLKQELIVRTTTVSSGSGVDAELSGSRTSLNSVATHVVAHHPSKNECETQTTARLSHHKLNGIGTADAVPLTNNSELAATATAATTTTTKSATTTSATASQNPIKHAELNGNAMSASSRLSSLNLVAELLRKVNVMETRLKASRKAMPPPRHLRDIHHITSLTPPIMHHSQQQQQQNHHLQHNQHHQHQQLQSITTAATVATATAAAAVEQQRYAHDKRHATAGD